MPLGHNKLNSMVKTMMSEAGVGGYYTNHSLRATAVSRLFQNDVDDNLIKVIPQKLKFLINLFETFLECSLPSTVSKKTIKRIGHHSRLRDMMGQSHPIYACTRANHAHYSSVDVKFCGSSKHTLIK